jgi:imidazole glycerol-phosphate synthase subunit HisH
MSAPAVTIIDYQLGNLFSVRKACEMLGCHVTVSSNPEDLRNANAVILPGVGAYGQAMENLRELDLIHPLLDHVAADKPLFGICLGLQLLFEESEEFGNPKGLGILKGSVRKLPVTDAPVPQIGWNRIEPGPSRIDGWKDTPLANVPSASWMYFVHSFHVENSDPEDALCRTEYAGFNYTSAALKGSVFATQFHPEKSSHPGIEIYRHWLASLTHP